MTDKIKKVDFTVGQKRQIKSISLKWIEEDSRSERKSQVTGAQAQMNIQTIGRPNVCQCEIRAAETLCCTALYCRAMEWWTVARIRSAAGPVLKKFYSQTDALICVEQATFVLYLHSCWIVWDELWSLFWFGKGWMRWWAKMQVKPQKPWALEDIVSVFFSKQHEVSANMENSGKVCLASVKHQGQLVWRGRKDPE